MSSIDAGAERAEGQGRLRASGRAALLLRWVCGLFLILYGLGGLNLLRSKWAPFTVLSISEPLYEPVTFLLLEVATVALGIALLWRKKWVFLVLAVHASLALWKCLRADEIQVGLAVLGMYLAADILVVTLCLWPWRKGALR